VSRIGILGSCVTAQAFQHRARPEKWRLEKPSLYVARTSLVSLMSPALPAEPTLLDLAEAKHERSWMEKDFTRSFWDELKQSRLDLLDLDFIDERFDLLEARTPQGPGYKLDTMEFAAVPATLEQLGYRRLRRFTSIVSALWQRSAKLFLDRMRTDHPGTRIALHRAPLLDVFEDGKPSAATDWWKRDLEYVASFSRMLETYEQTFLSLGQGVDALSVDPACRYLRRGHIWGEAPYHYGDAYYVQLVDGIRELRRNA
jgi:hypothetical protein